MKLTISGTGCRPDENCSRVANVGTVDSASVGDDARAGGTAEAHIRRHLIDFVVGLGKGFC